ncbi:MAG: ATP-binding protein, partial [Actinomycetota bacterium]
FIDALFGKKLEFSPPPATANDLIARAVAGGYPEAFPRVPARRRAWYRSYVTSLVQRDIRDLAEIEGLREIPNLLALIAARNAGLLNLASLSSDSALSRPTVGRYFSLLQAIFLVHTVPAWVRSRKKRIVKSPKVLMTDSGLAAELAGITIESAAGQDRAGRLLESFALMELRKEAGICRTRPELYHFRTHAGVEVDGLLEAPDGSIAGVEVKAGATVSASDFRSLRFLQDSLGDRFRAGVV